MGSFGKVVRLDWQVRDSGWLLDDLVVTSHIGPGRRSAGISIKSGQKVTVQGFPTDFVMVAWSQWLGAGTNRTFSKTADVVALVTGQGTVAAQAPWERLLREAVATSSDRMVERLTDDKKGGQQTSKNERTLFAGFCCPVDYQAKHKGDEETVDLIRQVRWLNFDYDSSASQDFARAIDICKVILSDGEAHRAAELWEKLKSIADEKRKLGGTLDLPGLLATLHNQFSFKDNPDYAGDWAALKARSDAELSGIKTEIAGLPRLKREGDLAAIAKAIDTQAACFLVGDSGSGKSALAKVFATSRYVRIVWLNGDMLDQASLPDFEKSIGLTHSISEIIDTTNDSTVIVFDAIEAYAQRAKKVAAQLVRAVLGTAASKRTHIIVTAQAEAAGGVALELSADGFPNALLEATPLGHPSEADVRAMVSGVPNLGWLALNPEARSLLTNLKMLDWFVRFAQSGGTINAANVGLTNLIDSLWTYWVESGPDRFNKSHLLKQVATIEADRHVSAVPTSALGHAEQATLGKLTDGELLRVRDERIRFSHDLLSDWSRLKVLIGEDWLVTAAARERYALPKWFRAIRLYGQRLLEQSGDNGESWRKHLESVDDRTPTDTLIRDLFLEALFLAPNAPALLRQAWPVLVSNGAKLLRVMIDRFLFVATVPDPRLALILGADKDPASYEHLMRFPFWPYWGSLLQLLHERRDEVAEVAPNEAAKVCAMWLRSMNFASTPNYQVVWRQEAAELAYTIARAAQLHDLVREPFFYGGTKVINEALLLAATELPTEAGNLCLELTTRRDLDPVIAAKIAKVRAKQREERKKEVAPKRRSSPPPISLLGPLRKPWHDGPRRRVDHSFVDACLDGTSYGAFAIANPEAALEVLLAVCIEKPQHEQYGQSSLADLGVNYWQAGSAAIWFRGPFFALLSAAPEQGLTFVIKLTNFVTERYTRGGYETFKIGGRKKRWLGDANVFTWHYDGHLMHGSILQCALMALEKWIYDRIDAGDDITSAISRILSESMSLALAGLLLDVGKKKSQLLVGPLAPLLSSWLLVEWDRQLTEQRNRGHRGPYGSWFNQPQEAIKMAQDWFEMPHRKVAIRDLFGTNFLTLEKYDRFFSKMLAAWEKHLSPDRKPVELRRLIESLRKSNYKFGVVDGKVVPIDFEPSAEDEAEDVALSQKASVSLQFLTLPLQCRRLLDTGTTLPTEQLAPLAELINSIREKGDADNDSEIYTAQDSVLGGVAVLMCLHHDWLTAHPTRLAWCRERLEEALLAAGTPPPIYTDINIGNDKWDAFAAECGVSLLVRDRTDPLARNLVAQGITGFFYSTTQLVVGRAARNGAALGGDFERVIVAVLEWSAIRPVLNAFLPQFAAEIRVFRERKAALEQSFADASLAPMLPDLKMLNAVARRERDEARAQNYPEHAGFLKSLRPETSAFRRRIELRPERLGFDPRLVQSALSWVRPDFVSPFSRSEIVAVIRTLLEIVLGNLPRITDPKAEEISELPTDFDSWVYEVVAAAIPLMAPAEKPQDLWQAILGLGPAGHQWIERFYWQWFTIGWEAKPGFVAFFAPWRAMIECALADPQWDHKTNWHHEIDAMVFELLGFNPGWKAWITTDGVGPYVEAMSDLYERAAANWFSLPKVLSGFAHFARHPAASSLAIKSIPWIAAAVRDYHDYSWRHGTEDTLTEFLSVCWHHYDQKITAEASLRTTFFELVRILAARGGHGALALQDRINSRTLN